MNKPTKHKVLQVHILSHRVQSVLYPTLCHSVVYLTHINFFLLVVFFLFSLALSYVLYASHHHHHHVPEGLGVFPVP